MSALLCPFWAVYVFHHSSAFWAWLLILSLSCFEVDCFCRSIRRTLAGNPFRRCAVFFSPWHALVVTSSISLALPIATGLAHFAAPPLPKKSCDFSGTLYACFPGESIPWTVIQFYGFWISPPLTLQRTFFLHLLTILIVKFPWIKLICLACNHCTIHISLSQAGLQENIK